MAAEQPGTVFIGEDVLADDVYLLTGRFSAHWEASEGREHRFGPEGVPVEEAIAWGRTQAAVVLVRLGEDVFHYSAGSRQPSPVAADDEDFPIWPEGKQVVSRRVPGMEHLDLVSDQPVPWRVRYPRRVSVRNPERDAERLLEVVERDAGVSEAACEVEHGTDRADAVLRFTVFARTHEEAMGLVFTIVGRSMGQVPFPVEELRGGRGGWVMDSAGWNPMDDIRPAPDQAGVLSSELQR
jgi:hypothetical protein